VLCALLFLAWTAESPNETVLYCGLWRSPFQVLGPLFVSLPGINLFPWQLLLFAVAPLCLFSPGAFRHRARAMDAAIFASVFSVAVTFLWGMLRGGSAYNAYYQLWKFLAALLMGALLLCVVRSARDLKAVGTTVVFAALVRGTLAVYFYWVEVRGKIDPAPPYMTNHEDSLLFVAGVVVVLAWALARAGWKSRLAAAVVCLVLLYAMVLNNRRLAWLELLFALGCMYVLLPRRGLRRRVNRWLIFAAPVTLAYVVVGWGRSEAVFAPVRALATSGSDEDASSLARLEENRNLIYTLWASGNPLLGTGWGQPYQQVTGVYSDFGGAWWQYAYMPHNSLLGVTVFGGLFGIFGIWFVVPVAAFLATRAHRLATQAVERAGGMAALGLLPAYAVQCYGDIGFQALSCGLVLAVAIATAGKVAAWAEAPRARAEKSRVRLARRQDPSAASA
jgi:hypothetical protein